MNSFQIAAQVAFEQVVDFDDLIDAIYDTRHRHRLHIIPPLQWNSYRAQALNIDDRVDRDDDIKSCKSEFVHRADIDDVDDEEELEVSIVEALAVYIEQYHPAWVQTLKKTTRYKQLAVGGL